jgi:hypothetical protein
MVLRRDSERMLEFREHFERSPSELQLPFDRLVAIRIRSELHSIWNVITLRKLVS